MHLREATLKAVSRFKPQHDDHMEALAAGINWKENITKAVTKGGCVMIQPFSKEQGCEAFPLAIGGNMGDQCWFVVSEHLERMPIKSKIEFIKLIKEYRDLMLTKYPVIWNFVWVGNKSHYRFLKAIGAEFHDEFTESPRTGERFQLFTIRR